MRFLVAAVVDSLLDECAQTARVVAGNAYAYRCGNRKAAAVQKPTVNVVNGRALLLLVLLLCNVMTCLTRVANRRKSAHARVRCSVINGCRNCCCSSSDDTPDRSDGGGGMSAWI